MLTISDVLRIPTLHWNQIIWYELLLIIIAIVLLQKLLNYYTENKLTYFLPKRTNIISYIGSLITVILTYVYIGDITYEFIVIAIAIMILLSTSLIDFHYQELPNEYNIFLSILALIYVGLNLHMYEDILISGLISFAVFFVIMLLTGGAIGGGDVKMSFAIGVFVGLNGLTAWVIITFLSGAVVAIILLLTGKSNRKDVFAFGPFMAYSCVYIMMFFI